jgi:hypothetical protein
MTKKDLEIKRDLARHYYMQGSVQKDIAEKVAVSENTIGKWVKADGWEAKRAACSITRTELVNKTLRAINTLLDDYNGNPDKAFDADKLCKLAKVISGLDKQSNVVDVIEVFMAFNKWLQFRMSYDKEVTPDLIKAVNRLQDIYITEQISK